MYTYLRINYKVFEVNSHNKKLCSIVGIFLTLMFLCVLSCGQGVSLQFAGPVSENKNNFKHAAEINIPENTVCIPGQNPADTFHKIPKKSTLSPVLLSMDISVIKALPDTVVNLPPAQPAASMPQEPSALPEIPETSLAPSFTPPASAEESSGNGEDASSAPGSEQTSPEDNINSQEFLCRGFLCDASGKIIDCPDITITDNLLCLPSDARCTGIAAGALASSGVTVYEIYIPANIIAIDEGAFDGLTELFFIQVHPDNPVYKSIDGYLCEK